MPVGERRARFESVGRVGLWLSPSVVSLSGWLRRMAESRNIIGELHSVFPGSGGTNGSAGKFMNDPALFDNANATMKEFQALLAEIRKDPKKYLRISVSIF